MENLEVVFSLNLSMDESAIKGMESNGSDHADNRKSIRKGNRKKRSRSRSVTMIVSGYDKSLPEDEIKSLLSEHFSSCGDITRVYFAADVETEIRNKHAFFYITGEDAKEKAMQLNGSDMGGRNLVVKVMPASTRFCQFTPQLAVSWFEQSEISRTLPCEEVVMVRGYDTALPEDDIKSALTKHFSSCGEIDSVTIPKDIDRPGLSETAALFIWGEAIAEKARALSGADMGGWKVEVTHCSEPRDLNYNLLHVGIKMKKAKMTSE